MKTIEVVAAIIIKDGQVFATQRGYGEWQGWWEFPGGKIEIGEAPEEALTSDNLHLNEHAASAWLTKETLSTVQWLPADVVLLDAIAERL